MTEALTQALAQQANLRTQVNEKLIKALITLLALKDEHLLDELGIVFKHAKEMHSEIGTAPREVWMHIDKQLGVIAALTNAQDEEQVEAEAGARH